MGGWQEQLAALEAGGPWFECWRKVGGRVVGSLGAGATLPEALNLQAGTALRFVPAWELPQGMAYEQYIFETGRCPTRDNLHDFFNGLCWLQWPLAKKRLNELQAGEIARAGVGGVRGPVRDAITVFDENGAVLQAPPELWQALVTRDWRRLFVDLRPLWARARLLLIGHALLEKLVQPRKDITAHVWRFPCPAGSMAEVDRWLAGQLAPDSLAAKPFTPLPVLGVPGWLPENQNFSFYDDSVVFRPPGRRGT
jgi:hypothetical protein